MKVKPAPRDTYTLVAASAINSGASSAITPGIVGGGYVWSTVGTFAGGSTLTLKVLGPDGVTWLTALKADGTAAAITASGSCSVLLGENASVRIDGTVANTTAVTSSLT